MSNEKTKELKGNYRENPLDALILILAIICPLFVNQNILIDIGISTILCFAMLYFLTKDKFILLLPIFILYSPRLFLYPGGVSLVNIYAVLFCIRVLIFKINFKSHLSKNLITILFLYGFIVIAYYTSFYDFIILCLGLIAFVTALAEINNSDNEKLKMHFIRIYIFMCFSASFYGLINQNIRVAFDDSLSSINLMARYSGTQNDPNYMAMFLCIGFCFMLSINMKNKILKCLLVITLFIMISFTGSMTGLLCCLLALYIYIVFNKKISWVKRITILLILFLGMLGFIYFVMNSSSTLSLFKVYSFRIEGVLNALFSNDVSTATSGRSNIQERYLEFYYNQSIFRQLFGGFCINGYTLKGLPFTNIGAAAHSTYIDILMTTGALGFVIFIGAVISSLRYSFRRNRGISDKHGLPILTAKLIWLIFASSISIFPSWTYFIILFLNFQPEKKSLGKEIIIKKATNN
ncbi:O-antigen ligase family protein [Bacillus benzoevorans]